MAAPKGRDAGKKASARKKAKKATKKKPARKTAKKPARKRGPGATRPAKKKPRKKPDPITGRVYSEDLAAELIASTEVQGCFAAAADLHGVSDSTVRGWMQLGREYFRELEEWAEAARQGLAQTDPPEESRFAWFYVEMKKAKARFEAHSLQIIRGAVVVTKVKKYVDGKVTEEREVERADWRAHAWLLERLNNRRYGSNPVLAAAGVPGEQPGEERNYGQLVLQLIGIQNEREEAIEKRAAEG